MDNKTVLGVIGSLTAILSTAIITNGAIETVTKIIYVEGIVIMIAIFFLLDAAIRFSKVSAELQILKIAIESERKDRQNDLRVMRCLICDECFEKVSKRDPM